MQLLVEPAPIEATGAWLPIRLTALLFIMDMVPIWYLSPLMITLIGLGIVFPTLLRVPAVWMGVTLVIAAWIVRLWSTVDNHHYLAAYWSLAIIIALCLPDPQRALAISARWLLAFMFLWAAVWKGLLSPDYKDGRFFTNLLMTDPRFEDHAQALSGLSRAEVRQNHAFLDPSYENPDPLAQEPVEFKSTPRLERLVEFSTWGLLAAETALALAFLFSWGRLTMVFRHGGLMLFCLATFAFAPVPTFGWLVLILGLAQVEPKLPRLRTLYVIVWFLLIFVSQFPWARFAKSLMQAF